MDKTLREYLIMADEAHSFVERNAIVMNNDKLHAKIIDMQTAIKTLQSVSKRIADISNILVQTLNHKTTVLHQEKKDRKYLDPYPTSEDHAVVRNLYPTETKEIVSGLPISVKTVNEIKEIPVASLYYVTSLQQFAVNVNGIIIKGNISNIVPYQTEKSARCEYGTECKSLINGKKCTYFHDPEDFLKLKKQVPDTTRNYTAGSWLYSKNKNPRTYFTRHVGSKDKLLFDLNTLKRVQYREEVTNREGQLIHDILIYMALNKKGFLEKYQHFPVISQT